MKPHIVFLAAWYPDEHDPMFGLFVHKHAMLMTKEYSVSVLHVTNYSDESNGLFVSEKDGVSINRLNIRTKNRLLRWLYFFVAGLQAYRYICKKDGRPVLNHVHVLTRMGVLAALIKCRRGIPYVVTEHWSRYFSTPGTYRNCIRKWFTHKVCKRSAVMSAVSNRLKDAMLSHGLGNRKKWLIINNIVNEKVFDLPAAQPAGRRIRFINVSCFEDRSKNLSGLVECVSQLVGDGIDIECVMVGSGEDFEQISSLIRAKRLESHIIMTGQLIENQVATQMKECHFYVQPSHYENVPVVISEALMCGLPVLATRVGGLNEMIDESNGYLVEPGHLNELCSAIRMMAENHGGFDRQNIRKAAMQKYSSEAVRQQMLQLYSEITK